MLVLAFLLSLPFLNRPFHIDDPNFLAMARHAWPHPLKLYDFTLNWGGVPERAFDILSNPPMTPWLLALLHALGGEQEWVYHLGFLPFLLGALWGMARLAHRFAPPEASATHPALMMLRSPMFLALASPALLVSSHSVMPDVPMLCCMSLGLALTIEGLDEGRAGRSFLGGLLAGFSALFRYSGVLVLPLILLYGLLRWNHRPPEQAGHGRRLLLALLGALLPSLLWAWASYETYGQVHMLAMAAFQAGSGRAVTGEETGLSLQLFPLLHKGLYQLSTLGLAIGGPALLLFRMEGARGRLARWGAGLGAGLWGLCQGLSVLSPDALGTEGLLFSLKPLVEMPLMSRLLLLLGFTGAGVLLGLSLRGLWEHTQFALQPLRSARSARSGERWAASLDRFVRRLVQPDAASADQLFLGLWVLGVLLFNERLLFASVRYLLPLLPPAVLLLSRAGRGQHQHPDGLSPDPERRGLERLPGRLKWMLAGLLLTPALAVGLSDLQQANAYRDAAQRFGAAPPVDKTLPAGQTWFTGHWGFQHYLEEQGARALDEAHGGPTSGDHLLVPLYAWPQEVPTTIRGVPSTVKTYSSPWSLRPCTLAGKGSFYSFVLAPNATPVLLPFAFASDPLEAITVWRVQ